MAARSRRIRHDDNTRAKIQASQLVNRLTKHALGEVDMTASQVNAATTLLRKVLPDLAATAVTDNKDNDLALLLREASELAAKLQADNQAGQKPPKSECIQLRKDNIEDIDSNSVDTKVLN